MAIPAMSARVHTVRQLRVVAVAPSFRSRKVLFKVLLPYPPGQCRKTSSPTTRAWSSPKVPAQAGQRSHPTSVWRVGQEGDVELLRVLFQVDQRVRVNRALQVRI